MCPLAVAEGRLHLTKTAHEPVIPADRRDRLLVEVAGLAVTILANPTPPERRGDRGRDVGPAGETPEAGDLQFFRLGRGAAFPPELEQGGRGGLDQGRGVGRAVGGEDRFQEAGDAVVRAGRLGVVLDEADGGRGGQAGTQVGLGAAGEEGTDGLERDGLLVDQQPGE